MDRMSNTAPTNATAPQVPEWTLADRLVKARHHAGLEQDELAEAIGIARSSLSAYENGRRTPRRPVLLSWALATGVPLEWLMEPLTSGSPESSGIDVPYPPVGKPGPGQLEVEGFDWSELPTGKPDPDSDFVMVA